MAPGNRKNPERAASSESDYSLMEFMRDFPDDETCLQWLWRTRFAADGVHAFCERCEVETAFKRYETKQQRQSWTCTACGHHVHPTAGTIFHKSSTALHLWFYAMYLMTSTRCGISAKQLERELGVTYKTAWRIFTLIRNELMAQDDEPMSGHVEMDEMYVGGRPRLSDLPRRSDDPVAVMNRQSRAKRAGSDKKVPVFGMVERGGRVAAKVVPAAAQEHVMPLVRKTVSTGSIVYTDESKIYVRAVPQAGYEHRTIEHQAKIYASGDVHTQTIEGFWSLVKRGISGTHHAVSPKWLQGYLNEYVWRYNHRDERRAMFLSLILRAARPAV